MIAPKKIYISFLKGTSRQHLIAFFSTQLVHYDSDLANLHAWEGKYGDLLMRQHIILWRSISHVDATTGGGETL